MDGKKAQISTEYLLVIVVAIIIVVSIWLWTSGTKGELATAGTTGVYQIIGEGNIGALPWI